jgi:hypothetical protein
MANWPTFTASESASSDESTRYDAAVVQLDLYLVGVPGDVVVRQYVAVGAHDDARAHPVRAVGPGVPRPQAERIPPERGGRHAHRLRDVYVDDGGPDGGDGLHDHVLKLPHAPRGRAVRTV